MDLTGTTGTSNRFQHYELLRRPDGSPWELGRGTMGVTYKAFDVNLRCEVALKVVNPALIHHPNARERFVREARAAARLRHRNIASVYHLGNDGTRFFYAMEFIDGETLDALVRRQGPLSPDATLRVLLQIARALAAASRQGVIHRDIKPGNLMVVHEDDDDHRVVKLIDFGLARATTSDEDAGNLTSNGFVGTPVYSSPEQMAEKPADARSDIYSLGVTAWFLLMGRPPFSGTVASIFQQHATKQPPWETLPAGVPVAVRGLLAEMLEKNPSRRPQSAVELRQRIDECRERLGTADSSTPPRPRANVETSKPAVVVTKTPDKSPAPAAAPREIGPGMILKGRYELLRAVGQGNSGRVFQARDRAAGDEVRALKIFRAELTDDTSKREIVAEEVRLIQAGPHANLIRLHAFERLGARAVDFLVQEWLRGFTLLDLLASRGGALPIAETVQVLAQAAAAVDHASVRGLDRLDLALHQLHFHFPTLRADSDDDTVRGLTAQPLSAWPRWQLKVNPLGAIHGGLGSSTWIGDVTLLPGATPALDRDLRLDDQPVGSAASYLRGLARATYETLGGAPGSPENAAEPRTKYVSLPALGEEANAVLQRALLDEPAPYLTSRAFCAALATAAGVKPPPVDERPVAVAGAGSGVVPRALPPAARTARVTIESQDGESSDFLGVSVPDDERESLASRSSVADRLALVSRGGRSWGWWPALAVTGLLAFAFAAVVAVAMIHHSPATKIRPADSRDTATPRASEIPRASAPPRASTPTLAARPSPTDPPPFRNSPPPTSMVAVLPAPVPMVAVPPPVETPQSTPPPLAPPPSARASLVKVHVESKPPGAEIRTAGKLLGVAPLDAMLPPGDHVLVAHYRNWPEVRRTVHLDADQISAPEEIHVIQPSQVPGADVTPAGAKNHRTPSPTPRRDGSRPVSTPSGDALIYFPTPSPGQPSPRGGLEPFLQPTPTPTPGRHPRTNVLPPDWERYWTPPPRKRSTDPDAAQPADGDD